MSRKTQTGVAIVALLIISSLCTTVAADQFRLDWWSIDGGGDFFTTGDAYELSGTIAQPDVGATMTGGDYELEAGIWSPADDESTCVGDLDGDDDTDQSDLGILLSAWSIDAGGDLDDDGDTDQADLGILLADWGCEAG